MNAQLSLPLRYSTGRWPRFLRDAVRCANAGAVLHDDLGFYQLKDKLLIRFGHFLGYDVQSINRSCETCDGTGRWHWFDPDWELCRRCAGTGTFRTDRYLLERWRLFDDVYHRPVIRPTQSGPVLGCIRGRIKHHVDIRHARLVTILLLLAFDWRAFLRIVFRRILAASQAIGDAMANSHDIPHEGLW